MPQSAAQRAEARARRAATVQAENLAALSAAVAAGVRKSPAAHNTATRLQLPGGPSLVLMSSDGAPTVYGRRYQELTEDLDNWDRSVTPVETSRGTYARHRALGRDVLVRVKRRSAVTGRTELKLTQMGENYYKNHGFEYVVHIPVGQLFPRSGRPHQLYEGAQQGGEDYVAVTDTRLENGEAIGGVGSGRLPPHLVGNEDAVRAHVAAAVGAWVASLPTMRYDEDPFAPQPRQLKVLWQHSSVIYFYDASRPLLFSALVQKFRPDGSPGRAEVILDRPLRGVPIVPDDFFDRAGVTPLAWESFPVSGPGCVPVQLAAMLKGRRKVEGEYVTDPLYDLAHVEARLDEVWRDLGYRVGVAPYDALTAAEARGLERPWRQLGVTARMVTEFCRRHDASCWVLHGAQLISRFDPPQGSDASHRPIIALNVWGDHAFFYESAAAKARISRMPVASCAGGTQERTRLVGLLGKHEDGDEARVAAKRWAAAPLSTEVALTQAEAAERALEALALEEPEREEGDPEPQPPPELKGKGRELLRSPNLEEDRRRLRRLGLSFTSVLGASPHELRALVVHRGQRRNGLTIRGLPDGYLGLEYFCRVLGETTGFSVPYHGQPLASLAHSVLLTLLHSRRAHAAPAVRERIWARQGGLCLRCRDALQEGSAELDHVVPLQSGGSNDEGNLQALCQQCHKEKTGAERQPLDRQVRFESLLSPEVLQKFHAGVKPRQLVFGTGPPAEPLEAPRVFCLDAVGCRRNALLKSPHPLPVFSPLDEVEVLAPGALLASYDFLYISCEEPRPLANGRVLPYGGPRWYWRETAAFLLARGVVPLESATHGLRASGHVQPQDLARAVELVRQTHLAGAVEHPFVSRHAQAEQLTKLWCNAPIGLWNKVQRSQWSETLSVDEEDAPAADLRQRLEDPSADEPVYRFLYETRLVSNRSTRSLGHVALCVEQLRVAQALELLEGCRDVEAVVGVKVDGIHFLGDAKAVERLAAQHLTFADGTPAFKLKRPRNLQDAENEEALLPRNAPAPPAPAAPLELPPRGWREHLREDVADAAWRDAALEAVVANGGAFVRGVAGVGKSTFLRKLIARLQATVGAENVFVTAFQHSSARIVGGDTLLHLLHQVGRKQGRWLIVDEISQVPIALLGDVSALLLVGWHVVLAGDFEGQLPPVADRWADAARAKDLSNSRLVQELAQGLRVDLLKNCRCLEDPEHFLYYTSLYGRAAELEALKEEARRRFRPSGDFWPDHALCASHQSRLKLNALLNARAARGREGHFALLRLAPEDRRSEHMTMAAQSCFVWPDLQLIGCGKGRASAIVNAVTYRVTRLERELVRGIPVLRTLWVVVDREMLRPGEVPQEVQLTADEALLHLRLGHAMTYHAAQGRTLAAKRVMLLGAWTGAFSLAHLIVGASRVTRGALLAVPGREWETGWELRGEAARGDFKALAERTAEAPEV